MNKKKVYTRFEKTIADLITPVAVYKKLRDHFPNALLLESADYHDRSDSKSYICLEPMAGFEAKGNTFITFDENGEQESQSVSESREIFTAFNKFHNSFEPVECDPTVNVAGLFGFTSFEAVRYMEDIVMDNETTSEKDNPDLKYQLFRFVLFFDHFKNELYIAENSIGQPSDSPDGIRRMSELLKNLNSADFNFKVSEKESSSITDDRFMEMVSTGVSHCKRGDVFQVVLSREFSQKFTGDDFKVYRSLRSINPSPYLFYFDYGDFKIFGSSPEIQIQIFDGVAQINPIAGTVKRGLNAKEDELRANALKNDPKENAEHVMLVDLARNDLSKSSDTVEVKTYAEIQRFSHVIHMVSKVSGELQFSVGSLDIFADTFPAGTLSGAPKYRALQIIDEQESVNRNFYGGSIGYFGFDGSVNQAIIIRSFLSKNNTLVYQAGAGIVVDSSPEKELEEVNNKMAALRKAIINAEKI